MAEPATRKALAFERFAARWPRYKGRRLQDFFYDQACAALGICNHSTWVRISPDDPRWDTICPRPNVDARSATAHPTESEAAPCEH